jgi:hypothetical protein
LGMDPSPKYICYNFVMSWASVEHPLHTVPSTAAPQLWLLLAL